MIVIPLAEAFVIIRSDARMIPPVPVIVSPLLVEIWLIVAAEPLPSRVKAVVRDKVQEWVLFTSPIKIEPSVFPPTVSIVLVVAAAMFRVLRLKVSPAAKVGTTLPTQLPDALHKAPVVVVFHVLVVA